MATERENASVQNLAWHSARCKRRDSTTRLKLKVNTLKSAVAPAQVRTFLGFSFTMANDRSGASPIRRWCGFERESGCWPGEYVACELYRVYRMAHSFQS